MLVQRTMEALVRGEQRQHQHQTSHESDDYAPEPAVSVLGPLLHGWLFSRAGAAWQRFTPINFIGEFLEMHQRGWRATKIQSANPMKVIRLISLLGFTAFAIEVTVLSAADVDAGATTPRTKTCFQCTGTGTTKCSAPTCVNGQVDCPGGCIMLRRGVWAKHPELNRSDPNETMQLVMVGGRKAYVSSHHEGVVYSRKPDGTIDMQTCPVCNGTTRVQCKVCQGKGVVTCPICDGKKVVPESWTAFDNPKLKNRPSRFTLKDGSVIVGYKKMASGSTVIVRTEKGDEKLQVSDIVSEEKPPAQK